MRQVALGQDQREQLDLVVGGEVMVEEQDLLAGDAAQAAARMIPDLAHQALAANLDSDRLDRVLQLGDQGREPRGARARPLGRRRGSRRAWCVGVDRAGLMPSPRRMLAVRIAPRYYRARHSL